MPTKWAKQLVLIPVVHEWPLLWQIIRVFFHRKLIPVELRVCVDVGDSGTSKGMSSMRDFHYMHFFLDGWGSGSS